MLANTQNFVFQKLHGYFPPQNDLTALAYYHKALRTASEMMKLPHMHNSDETIGAITFFMGHHVSRTFCVGHLALTYSRLCTGTLLGTSGASIQMHFRRS